MHDASGNILSKAYEYSIEGTAITAADRISKAIWKLTHAQAKRRTKRDTERHRRSDENANGCHGTDKRKENIRA